MEKKVFDFKKERSSSKVGGKKKKKEKVVCLHETQIYIYFKYLNLYFLNLDHKNHILFLPIH